ncbi:hypothetical protein ABT369_49230 [Dactylosporangium sp. NPDC000244]|uniref:hypothetical protein n=1 Tax=Dactylosporangium sp. NPDC000244 TaxID=3154365 RepID=UPI00331FF7C7|nr:hypothetical protein GCM10020063_018700 [Dactylosporangium thailandense]
MDALTTARRVLRWSAEPDGPPPTGTLTGLAALGAPDPVTVHTLRWATGAASARIGAGEPPLGDAGGASPAALMLAAAIGGRAQPELSGRLLDAVPPVRLTRRDAGWAECVARHAVAGPAMSAEPPAGGAAPELVEKLLTASPLTMVLHRPAAPDGVAAGRNALNRLLTRPGGAAVLVRACAAPSADALVLRWRAQVLDQLRQERPAVLLDVYVGAFLWHRSGWDAAVEAARRDLTGRPSPHTVAVLLYWLPMLRADDDEQRRHGLGLRIEERIASGSGDPAAPGTTIAGRILLDRTWYRPVLDLVRRHRASLTIPGGG